MSQQKYNKTVQIQVTIIPKQLGRELTVIIRIVLRIHEFSYNNQSSIIFSGFKISWICENTWSAHQMIPEISNSESMIFFANFFNWGQNWPKIASINQRPDQYTYQVSVYLPSISILIIILSILIFKYWYWYFLFQKRTEILILQYCFSHQYQYFSIYF